MTRIIRGRLPAKTPAVKNAPAGLFIDAYDAAPPKRGQARPTAAALAPAMKVAAARRLSVNQRTVSAAFKAPRTAALAVSGGQLARTVRVAARTRSTTKS